MFVVDAELIPTPAFDAEDDLDKLIGILGSDFTLSDKDEARSYFNQLRQKFIDWNYTEFESDDFKKIEKEIDELYNSKSGKLTAEAEALLKA